MSVSFKQDRPYRIFINSLRILAHTRIQQEVVMIFHPEAVRLALIIVLVGSEEPLAERTVAGHLPPHLLRHLHRARRAPVRQDPRVHGVRATPDQGSRYPQGCHSGPHAFDRARAHPDGAHRRQAAPRNAHSQQNRCGRDYRR